MAEAGTNKIRRIRGETIDTLVDLNKLLAQEWRGAYASLHHLAFDPNGNLIASALPGVTLMWQPVRQSRSPVQRPADSRAIEVPLYPPSSETPSKSRRTRMAGSCVGLQESPHSHVRAVGGGCDPAT